jgi:uncharacterized damage-inducible protein DinB
MELNNIRPLYDYNRWASRRILTVASTLASDDFIRPMGNSFSSIRDTLAHILSAEWIWLGGFYGPRAKSLRYFFSIGARATARFWGKPLPGSS